MWQVTSAQHWGQLLTFEGKSCSHSRAFTRMMYAQWVNKPSDELLSRTVLMVLCSAVNEKLCEKKQPSSAFVENARDRHDLEKLCEKRKQQRSPMMPLFRRLEELL
jgi:hypothetical protein